MPAIVSPVSKTRRILVLAILAGWAFILLVGHGGIASSHEARVADSARAMALSGWPWNAHPVSVPRVAYRNIDGQVRLESQSDEPPMQVNPWGVPVMAGHIRLQKPPLPYWVDAICFRLMGRSALTARIVPALMGALATFILFDLATMLLGRRIAWYAALIWVSSYFVPEEYRKTMADPYLGFFTLSCLWAWVKATRAQRRARWLIIAFYLLFSLGLLGKGPPLFVHVAIAIGAFHLCFKRAWPGRWIIHVAGIVLALLIVLPWPVYVLTHVGVSDVLAMWRYQSIGELGANTENARPWWFYIPQVPLLIAPWFSFAGLGLVYLFARPKGADRHEADPVADELAHAPDMPPARRHQWFPLIWFVATALFFSFVNLKKNAYLLPAMPALALLMAQGARFMVGMARGKRKDPAPRILAWSQAICGIAFALWLAWLLLASVYRPGLAIALPLVAVGLAAAIWPFRMIWTSSRRSRAPWIDAWLTAQSIAYVILVSLLLVFYNGAKDNRESPKAFIAALTPQFEKSGITLYRMEMSPEAAFYIPDTLPPYDPNAARIGVLVEQSSKRPEPRGPAAFAQVRTNGTITGATRVAWDRVSGWALYELTVEQPATRPEGSR